MEFEIIYYCIVQASGHGKFIVDSQSGVDKTPIYIIYIYMYLKCIVVHHEAILEGVRTVITHTRYEGGFFVIISQVFY